MANQQDIDYKKLSEISEKTERKYMFVEMALDRFLNKRSTDSKTSIFDVFQPSKWRQAGLALSGSKNNAPIAKLFRLVNQGAIIRDEEERYRQAFIKNLNENKEKNQEKLKKEYEAKLRGLERALKDGKIDEARYNEIKDELASWLEKSNNQIEEDASKVLGEMGSIVKKYGIALAETGKPEEALKEAESKANEVQKELKDDAEIEENFYKAVSEPKEKTEVVKPTNDFLDSFRTLLREPPLEQVVENLSTLPSLVVPQVNTQTDEQQAIASGYNKRTEQALKDILDNTTQLVKITNEIAKVQKERSLTNNSSNGGLGLMGDAIGVVEPLAETVASTVIGSKIITTIANKSKSILTTKKDGMVVAKDVSKTTDLPDGKPTTLSTKTKPNVSTLKRLATVGKSFAKAIPFAGAAFAVAEGVSQASEYKKKADTLDLQVSRGEMTKERADELKRTYRMQSFVKTVSGAIPFVGEAIGDYISEKIEPNTTVSKDESVKNTVVDKSDKSTSTNQTLDIKPTVGNDLKLIQPNINNFTVSDKGFGTDGSRLTTVSKDTMGSKGTTQNQVVDASTKIVNAQRVQGSSPKREFVSFNPDKSLQRVRNNWKIG